MKPVCRILATTILLTVVIANLTAKTGDDYYAARVSAGGDISPMDIGFTWMFANVALGIFILAAASLIEWRDYKRHQ